MSILNTVYSWIVQFVDVVRYVLQAFTSMLTVTGQGALMPSFLGPFFSITICSTILCAIKRVVPFL